MKNDILEVRIMQRNEKLFEKIKILLTESAKDTTLSTQDALATLFDTCLYITEAMDWKLEFIINDYPATYKINKEAIN